MKIQSVAAGLLQTRADAWCLFVENGKTRLPSPKEPLVRRLALMAKRWMEETDFKGKAGEVSVFPVWETLPVRHVVLAGLGNGDRCRADALFRSAGAAARALRRVSARSAAVSLSDLSAISPRHARENLEAFLTGFWSGQYEFARYRTERADRERERKNLDVLVCEMDRHPKAARAWLNEIALLNDTLREVMDIANLPGNEAPPEFIAAQARRLAKKHGLTCEVWDRAGLERKRCGGILAVGRGSVHGPRLIILRYRGTAASDRPVALIGKTITFDSGGISLKPGKGMEWMKFDKSGGMAVLAATIAAARLRLRQPVVGILAVAENMPGGSATRPGDIVRTYAGKTVEVLNTDAEGRLVLADALAVAAEFKPAAIVDLATLTGACIVALGHVLAGLMANQERLAGALQTAGNLSGERVWPLPLLPEYDEDIKSDFADMKNIGNGGAGTIIGGAFLKQFVPADIPWAHLDIAGTAYLEKPAAHRNAGATLFGTRLLLQWLRGIKP